MKHATLTLLCAFNCRHTAEQHQAFDRGFVFGMHGHQADDVVEAAKIKAEHKPDFLAGFAAGSTVFMYGQGQLSAAAVEAAREQQQRDMSALQIEVGAWCNATFKGQPLDGVFAHLWEELHEVFENCPDDESREEAADCALIVMEIACKLGIALRRPPRFCQKHAPHIAEVICDEFEEAMRRKFELCKRSKWRMDDHGVFHREK